MLSTFKAVVREKKVVFLEEADLPEGTEVLVTVLPSDSATDFWQAVSQPSLDKIWNNLEDEIYAKLL
jgi:hypothetical protein